MPQVPAFGPTPTFLPAMPSTDLMPLDCSVTKWNGVSYIGKTARMLRICPFDLAQSVPFQACSAGPIVVMPSSAFLPLISIRFDTGPCDCCVDTWMPSFSVSSVATTPP